MSKRKPISQTEARRMRAELADLKAREQARVRSWVTEYPGGVNLGCIRYESDSDLIPTTIRTARRLGCAVVVVDDGNRVRFYGVKP